MSDCIPTGCLVRREPCDTQPNWNLTSPTSRLLDGSIFLVCVVGGSLMIGGSAESAVIIGFNPFDWLLFVYCGWPRLARRGSSRVHPHTHTQNWPEPPPEHNYICCQSHPSSFIPFSFPFLSFLSFFGSLLLFLFSWRLSQRSSSCCHLVFIYFFFFIM